MSVIRIFRASVYPGKEEVFKQYMLSSVMSRLNGEPGLISVQMGAPHEGRPRDFVTVMIWKDLDAIKAFAGDRWQEPVLHMDEAHYVDEVYVEHYDLIAVGG